MKKDDVFQFSDGNSYKIQSIETEWVRATKLVNGKPQKGRPAKLARPLVEAVFNPLGIVPVATQSGVSTVTSTTSATAPVEKTDEERAAEQAAKDAEHKRFIAESLAMMKEGGGVDLNKEPGDDEIDLPDEEVAESVTEDLSKVFE